MSACTKLASAPAAKLGDDLLAAPGVAPGEDQGGAFPGRGPGDAGTETLGAAADQDNLPGEEFFMRLPGSNGELAPSDAVPVGVGNHSGLPPSRTSRTPVRRR